MKTTHTLLFLFLSYFGFSQTLSLDTRETYAVVVGISDYQDEQIPDLRFADKDALAFAGFLQSPAGGSLDEDHLKVLINEQATAAQFAIALDWLMEVVKENDKVLLYFSGHGDVERKTITQPGYFLCWDAPSRVYMAGGALALPIFQDVISTLSVQNKAKVIVISDACRSGKLSGSSVGGAQLTSQNLAKQYANEIKILSCQPEEFSHEGEQWGGGRGAFSYHLLDGLYGLADGNKDRSVSLMEIGRYLEDNVSKEVSPNSQIPMVIGNRVEPLVTVFPEILEELKKDRKGQMRLFSATDSRGIEEDVLASVDTITQKIYSAFKRALKEKQFLEPMDACADAYYEILIKDPKMGRLHSSMRRNYAAALQDDAQQFLNILINSGLTPDITHGISLKELYRKYPPYLERAAEILGESHYMYKILLARKHYFTNRLLPNEESIPSLQKALRLQPDMAHAMVEIVWNSKAEHADSAKYYAQQAMELVPSWVEPYLALAMFYARQLNDFQKAEELLQLAGKIDPDSKLVWLFKGDFYEVYNNYELAEKWYLKIINSLDSSSQDVCFPCVFIRLSRIYQNTNRLEETEIIFLKLIQTDSSARSFNDFGWYYLTTDQFEKAEHQFLKAMEADSHYFHATSNLGLLYTKMGDYEKAEQWLRESLELAPDNLDVLVNYAVFYSLQNQPDKAFEYLENALSKGYTGTNHIMVQYEVDLSALREQKEKWNQLMQKYFPDQYKK